MNVAQPLPATTDDDMVAVVIPAYNAQATLDETLDSVRAQTHRALEIFVVDDGSTDGTRALAERHAAADPRLRVITQANAGVAAARNTGWRSTRARWVAFVDADDLWAPTKIERQLAALRNHAPHAGLAYCWSARIDAAGAVIALMHAVPHEGAVLRSMLQSNFVASGSAALVRREALEQCGGFDSTLRARGGEGCEDWLLYAQVAARWEFALVPERLVGYRATPQAMSTHRVRMLRSHVLMCQRLRNELPAGDASALRRGLRNYGLWLFHDARACAGWGAALTLLGELRSEPRVLAQLLLRDLPTDAVHRARNRLSRLVRRARPLPPRSDELPSAVGRRFLQNTAPDYE